MTHNSIGYRNGDDVTDERFQTEQTVVFAVGMKASA